jgi:hypothetical protein
MQAQTPSQNMCNARSKSTYHGENTVSYIKQFGIDIVVAPSLSQGTGGNS